MKVNTHKKRLQNARQRRYNRSYQGGNSYIETFITQCIISGIILSALLVIRIIDVPATAAIREQFYQTITATADMPNDARNLGEIIRQALGNTESSEPVLRVPETQPVHTNSPAQDFRIDEDVLRSIRGDD